MRAMARWAAILAGGVFSLSAASLPKTYQHDVQKILERRCVTCHQAGEIAPMAFTSYAQVRPWASAIREALLSHKMPPWHAAPGTAHAFRNDRSLNKDEVDSIGAWVDAGAPEGGASREYVAPARPRDWKLGKPDMVIQVPGFQVPKTGQAPYTFLIVPKRFEHDTWIRAAEFRIDQR